MNIQSWWLGEFHAPSAIFTAYLGLEHPSMKRHPFRVDLRKPLPNLGGGKIMQESSISIANLCGLLQCSLNPETTSPHGL